MRKLEEKSKKVKGKKKSNGKVDENRRQVLREMKNRGVGEWRKWIKGEVGIGRGT